MSPTVQLAIRLPRSTADRLAALVAKRTKERPHMPATTTELVKEALELLLAREDRYQRQEDGRGPMP